MRTPFIQFLILVLLAFQLTSCVTTHKVNYLQPPINFVPAYKDTVRYQDYRLKVGDKLYIQVYSLDNKTNVLFNGSGNTGMQSMAGDGSSENLDLYVYTIQPNGSIKLPLIDELTVQGKTIRECKEFLEESIRPILKLNSVDVRMIGRYFSVIGSGKSGRFAITKEKMNIFQAIAMAGDLGIFTDRSKIRILRETAKGTQIKSFDVRSVDIIHSEFYYLEPNDVIFLQPMKEQFLGMTTIWSAVSTLVTTYSFGVIIYKSFF